MKPAVDEMFPEGAGPYVDLDEAGGSTGLLMDLAANEKAVHADFFNGEGLQRRGSAAILKISLMMRTSSELSCPAMQC
ncbi:COP9 signalosome complex subunit 9 isoform X1 [Patagioenas fasciata]|uniref:COP9 signalosome complex subunit 9 isoform X1 n=1 Tax=Patagioenas fasciata TaxID=372321 RepID=UPI0032E8D29E